MTLLWGLKQLLKAWRTLVCNFMLAGAAANGDSERVYWILNEGANVNYNGKDGTTVLMIAIKEAGNIDIIRSLLKRGADAKAANQYGKTALMLAREKNRSDIEQALQEFGATS